MTWLLPFFAICFWPHPTAFASPLPSTDSSVQGDTSVILEVIAHGIACAQMSPYSSASLANISYHSKQYKRHPERLPWTPDAISMFQHHLSGHKHDPPAIFLNLLLSLSMEQNNIRLEKNSLVKENCLFKLELGWRVQVEWRTVREFGEMMELFWS